MNACDDMMMDDGLDRAGLQPETARELGLLVHALCAQQRNALLGCADPERLERVSLHLWRMLRGRSGLRLELIQPKGTESLLEQFNDLMRSMPLGRARSEPPTGAALTVWVLKLSRRLELPEVRLLLKLVQDFPGAGVRLLLLCTREAAAHRDASDWGSRIYRCRLDEEISVERALAMSSPSTSAASWIMQPAATPAPVLEVTSETMEPPAHEAETRRWTAGLRALGWHGALQRRWALGLGGVLLSVSGTALAWWHARGDEASQVLPAQRRPVPEVVELLDDARPRVANTESRT